MTMSDYKVAKVQERQMPVPGMKNDGADVFMDASKPWGPASNPASNSDFKESFSAEKDLQALITAAKIRRDKARYGKAIELRDRLAAVRVNTDAGGGPLNERKGPNNQGIRTRANNSFDNRAAPNKPTSGVKADGGKGRW
jgi:hypothetical protein